MTTKRLMDRSSETDKTRRDGLKSEHQNRQTERVRDG